MGFFDQRIVRKTPTPAPKKGGINHRWDADLEAVPDGLVLFDEESSGITQAQVDAGLSVVGGQLVVTTADMVSAGASGSFEAWIQLGSETPTPPSMYVEASIEDTGGTSTATAGIRTYTYDSGGVRIDGPPGTSAGTEDVDDFVGMDCWEGTAGSSTVRVSCWSENLSARNIYPSLNIGASVSPPLRGRSVDSLTAEVRYIHFKPDWSHYGEDHDQAGAPANWGIWPADHTTKTFIVLQPAGRDLEFTIRRLILTGAPL